MAECGVCSTIKLVAAAAQPHRGALEFVASPWSHENRKVLAGYVQGNLEVTVRGVETAEVDGVAVDFRYGVSRCTDGMSGSTNVSV